MTSKRGFVVCLYDDLHAPNPSDKRQGPLCFHCHHHFYLIRLKQIVKLAHQVDYFLYHDIWLNVGAGKASEVMAQKGAVQWLALPSHSKKVVGSLLVLLLPTTVQKHSCKMNWNI